MKIPSWKIDWPNHVIGFFSALFGILIAFELDEWRERKNEQELAARAFEKLRQEVKDNKTFLHETVNINLELIQLLEDHVLPHLSRQLQFTGSKEEADSLNKHHRLKTIAYVDYTGTASHYDFDVHIGIGNLLQPTLHYSAWESAKATGALNFMEYEKVLSLSSLYNATKITDELTVIKSLIHQSDKVNTKEALVILIGELKEAHNLIQAELQQFDVFVNILDQME